MAVSRVTLATLLVLGTFVATTTAKALGDGTCFSYSYECMFENTCVDNGNGTFRCSCPQGTSGNGFKKEMGGGGCTGTCKATSECPEFAVCDLSLMTIGVCRCKSGFTGDAIRGCTDINECALQGNPYRACDAHAVCMNSPGSYSCSCLSHYRGDGFTCQWVCSSAADCAAGRSRCVRPGDYCECLSGFTGDGLTCNDIDECATDPNRCPVNNVCVNTIGNYTCKCKPGYALNPDTNLCVALARHCDERLTWDSKMKSGYFTVDFDFDGPVEPKQVYCDVRDGYAITEVQFGKGESFPREVPRTSGEDRAIDYGMRIDEIRKLVDNSPYCSQTVSLSCTAKYGSGTGTFSWKDGQGTARTSWGGTSIAGKCACGQFNACNKVTSGCNCGNGLDAVDEGIMFDKTQLPVQSVTFPSSGGAAGYYDIGRLRCASRPVDIPRNCHDVKFTLKKKLNLVFPIDPDGFGGVPPTLFFCDVETYRHTGVSRASVTNPTISSTTVNGEDLKYLVPVDSIKALVDGSVFCSQRVEFKCRSTISSGRVQVTSRSGPLSYYFGGSRDVPGSCGCGLSASCTANSSVLCRCDDTPSLPTSDFGFILDKSDMPVLNIRSMATDGSQIAVGPLECAEKQFGIEPNCEKYRQAGITNVDYGLRVDPDGPGNNSAPFPVQCKIDDLQGITIVRHNVSAGIVGRGPFKTVITYLRVTADQLALLKKRSTYCTQNITFTYSGSVNPANIQLKYSDGNSSSVLSALPCQSSGSCAYSTGTGMDYIVLSNMDQLPLTEISASSSAFIGTGIATIVIGPMMCSEIFPDCAKYLDFVKTQGVEGEVNIAKDLLTIDPDGPADGKPITVSCVYSDTYIDKPNATIYRIVQKPKSGPIGECFSLTYTDRAGKAISESQLARFVSNSRRCQQNLQVTCTGAPVVGFVYYRRCGSTVNETTLASSLSSSWCECGIHGACDPGPTAQCNCDISPQFPNNTYLDTNTISETSRLPICEVCLQMAAFPSATTVGVPSKRLTFYVGQLKCGRGFGGPYNCQRLRQDPAFSTLKNRTLEYMWFDGEDKPVPVGCIFDPYPPVGQIILSPLDNIFDTVQNVVTNRNVVYKSINITLLRTVINSSNYCTQIIYFFGTPSVPQLADPYGLFSLEQKIQSGVSTRALSADETSGACQDTRYAALCSRWGQPTGLAVTNKGFIPVTRISLAATAGTITVAINDATCAYVEKDCEAIRQSGQSLPVEQNFYVIDPDQAGASPPLQAECEFTRDQGITKIGVNDTILQGTGGSAGTNQPFYFQFKNVYVNATPEQVHTLAQNSAFCWQGVKYVCSQAGLIGDNSNPEGRAAYYSGNSSSFGTGYNTNAVGCACGLLGTCTAPDVSCNCDARGPMSSDQGFITDPAALPVTGFYKNIRSPGGRGQLSLTGIRCAPSPIDIPRDCVEAYSYGFKFGVNYTISGEYLINPDNTSSQPFLAYCDFSNPSNPVTILRPRQPRDRVPVRTTTTVDYPGPVSDSQLAAIVRISSYCYQPVRVQCVGAKFIAGGVRFAGVNGVLQSFFSAGSGSEATCTCGTLQRCGGTRSYSQQRATKCNCDIGDSEVRSDAAILSIKGALPLRRMIGDIISGSLNLTTGALYCAPNPIEFNECDMGMHDCGTNAQCVDLPNGYDCVCPEGWKGLGRAANDLEAPAANGRQCIDDNECFEGNDPCPYNARCFNTPGSFVCNCSAGYRNVDRLTCKDIDECAERTHDCDVNAKCTNTDGSYRCSCLMGYRGDGRRGNCLPVGQCTCFGDPHCLSFDKAWVHHQGLCEYTMIDTDCEVSGAALPRFRISSINWDRGLRLPGAYAFMRAVRIALRGNEILLDQDGTITVNGRLRNNMWTELNDDQTETLTTVTRVGLYKVKVSTDFGLDLTWNGRDAVEILVPTSLVNKTCGLCGNYDGDDSNDMIVGPECPSLRGTVTRRHALFGNSWTVNASEECRPDCDPPEPEPTCVSQYRADYMCAKLFNSTSPFAACLEKMSRKIREGLQYSCVYDMCHTNDSESSVCEFAETLANFCEEVLAGEPVVWRSHTLCGEPECNSNERFYICGPSEESTCNNPEPTYFPMCREGCICIDGYRRQGPECLPEARCGCIYGEDLMKIGSQQVLNNCSLLTTCVAHEDYSEEPYSCSPNEVCAVTDGVETCVCAEGTMQDSATGECLNEDNCLGGAEACASNSVCVSTRNSFFCNCSEGYRNVDRLSCEDVDECAEDTDECDGNAVCTNVDGSYTCACAEGYLGDGKAGTCKQDTDCLPGNNLCPDNSRCVNTPESFNCECNEGYVNVDRLTCADIDECEEGTSNCDLNAVCTNNNGSYGCACKTGYIGTGQPGSCTDIDECADGSNNCDVNADCTNSNGSFDCTCQNGYRGDGTAGSCSDIDECADGSNNCDENADCTNSNGSFDCTCQNGYRGDGTAGTCSDINECEEGISNCDANAACVNVEGSFQCACAEGYLGDGTTGSCTEDTDCSADNNPCSYNSECVNTPESFYCLCASGYRNVDQLTCADIDECAEGNDDCDGNAICTNVPGSFECACVEGYLGDGKAGSCKKDDDCSPENNRCSNNSVCVNTPDSFYCNCSEGYRNIDPVACADIDECADGSHNCDVNALCTNQDGSFQCACLEGYLGDGTFGTCVQPNLCVDVSCEAPNTECRNGLCVCKSGFALDCEKCEDIDECTTDENTCGHLGQVCINTPGSYRCECVDGFYSDGGYCHDINECEDGSAVCGQHSECRNLLGTYECMCCMGYTKRGAACRRDRSLDVVYGAPGEECCSCLGGDCEDPNPVCASNGQTYPNYASMVVSACRDNVTLDVSYSGYCENSCSGVVCSRPYQTCVETARGALCVCPTCDSAETENATPVCGSNGRLYPSECVFQLIMCSMGTPSVTLRPLQYCSEPRPDSESPLAPWSEWSQCSPTCGKGYRSRSRSAVGQTGDAQTQRAACYTPCENGPCDEDSCPNPGQVCEVGDNSEAVCTCPDCTGQPEEPVCALLGDLVRTFENECQLRRTACQLTRPFRILEDRACEDKPPTCTKTSYIPEVVEGDCVAKLPEDLGFCYGKCGQNPAWCCRPEGTETVSLNVTFDCQDGSSRSEQRDFIKIQSCSCTQEPQRHSDSSASQAS